MKNIYNNINLKSCEDEIVQTVECVEWKKSEDKVKIEWTNAILILDKL